MKQFEKSDLGRRLKALRSRSGLSIRETADKVGVAESTYREWEYGRAIRGEQSYIHLAQVFGVSIHELITGHGPTDRRREALDLIEEGLRVLRAQEE